MRDDLHRGYERRDNVGHATSLSLGQGCNAALEDVMILDKVRGEGRGGGGGAGGDYEGARWGAGAGERKREHEYACTLANRANWMRGGGRRGGVGGGSTSPTPGQGCHGALEDVMMLNIATERRGGV